MDSLFLRAFLAVKLLLSLRGLTAYELQPEESEDYCLKEVFQPRCPSNEVILMRSATYGRMRIGRCITSQEVDVVGSRHLGCSADVLHLLHKKCSGKQECEIRVFDFSDEIANPCPPGLYGYLVASYDCINAADGRRSCMVNVSPNPVYIIGSNNCGTDNQSWTFEAPVGQNINISLLQFPNPASGGQRQCNEIALIVDKTGKRNTSVCADGTTAVKNIVSSHGNTVSVYFSSQEPQRGNADGIRIVLKFAAVGCSDIIPPEDAYLKRKDDLIMITCYSSRKSWHLNCVDGKWIGVVGNCSNGMSALGSIDDLDADKTATIGTNDQVLAIVALGGFTLTVCLAVLCFGVVCLRRYHGRAKLNQDYKSLNRSRIDTSTNPHVNQELMLTGNDQTGIQPMPTYSVYVGEGNYAGSNIQ